MPIQARTAHGYFSSALEQADDDALAGWAELLLLGRLLLPHLGGPRTDSWWKDRRIQAAIGEWKHEAFHPWRDRRRSPGGIALERGWIEQLRDRAGSRPRRSDLAVTTLAAILFADDPLQQIVQRRLASDPRPHHPLIDHAERCGLVYLPPPTSSWWGRRYSAASNPALGERLKTFALPDLPVKVYPGSAVGLPPGRDLELRIRLLRVDASLDWFELEAARNKTTGRPGFVVHCRNEEWPRNVKKAMETGWLCEAHVTILPEMVVSRRLWRDLQELHEARYRENLVVAGSGHVRTAGELWANRSALVCTGGLDANGEPTVSYLKSYAFALRQGEASFSEWSRKAGEGLREEAEETGVVHEALEAVGGTERWPLVCIDSPWGRLAIAICRDLLIDAGNQLIRSLIDARVDHLLVPSYNPGPETEFHRTADVLRRHGIATFLTDGCPTGSEAGGRSAAGGRNPLGRWWLVRLPSGHSPTRRRDRAHGFDSLVICLKRGG